MIANAIKKLISEKLNIYSEKRIFQYNRVLEFITEIGDTENITQEYVNRLFKHLSDKGLSNSSSITYLKALTSALNYSSIQYSYRLQNVLRGVRNTSIQDKVYLNNTELKKLHLYKTNNPSLDKVKDLFIFASYTGLRHNELMRLKKTNIVNKAEYQVLLYTTSKNNKTNEVPLNKICLEIINKWSRRDFILPTLSNAKCNEYLHRLLLMFGYTDSIVKVHYIGNKRIEQVMTKAELITFHSSRHSFVSNLIDRGMSFQDLSDLIGVSTNTLTKWYSHSNTDTRNKKALNILNNL